MPFNRPSLSQREIINTEPLKVVARFGLPQGVITGDEELEQSVPDESPPFDNSEYFEVPNITRIVSQTVVVRNGQTYVDVVLDFGEVPNMDDVEARVILLGPV